MRVGLTLRRGTHYHFATRMRDLAPSKSAIRAFLLAVCALLAFAATSRAQSPVPAKPAAYVNDYAGVLDAATVTQLTNLCTEINTKAQSQMFIVTVKTTGDVPIEQFSIDLATKWGVGPKASSSGVLILYAIDDRKSRIEVGYGLEGALNDGKVGDFMREAAPTMRSGDYSGAIFLVARRVADVIAQERGVTLSGAAPPRPVASDPGQGGGVGTVIAIMFIIFIVIMIMRNSGGGGRTGRGGGGSGWWIGPMIGSMMGGGGGGGGWSGGGGGGFGGGFGGGGGGSFGGGGATGSW
jgi:uncharacterized protein